MRSTIALLGVGAVAMALRVQSVQALWFFTSDLVFVLLFPQLVSALFDPRANLAGSVVAFTVSLVLRLGGGEPLFGLAPLIPYPEIAAHVLPMDAARWYDEAGALLFPFKTLAAVTGLVLLPLVSRAHGVLERAAAAAECARGRALARYGLGLVGRVGRGK